MWYWSSLSRYEYIQVLHTRAFMTSWRACLLAWRSMLRITRKKKEIWVTGSMGVPDLGTLHCDESSQQVKLSPWCRILIHRGKGSWQGHTVTLQKLTWYCRLGYTLTVTSPILPFLFFCILLPLIYFISLLRYSCHPAKEYVGPI